MGNFVLRPPGGSECQFLHFMLTPIGRLNYFCWIITNLWAWNIMVSSDFLYVSWPVFLFFLFSKKIFDFWQKFSKKILTLSVLSPMWSIVYVAAKRLVGYIHVQTMLISPAIPGPRPLFLKIPKSNYLFCENYTIFTLIVPENFKAPRNSRKYQGVRG